MNIYVKKEHAVTGIKIELNIQELIVLATVKNELDACLGDDGELIRNPIELPEHTVRGIRTLLRKIVQDTKGLQETEAELLYDDEQRICEE